MKSRAIITVQFSSGAKQTFVLSDAKANEVCAVADNLSKTKQPQQASKAAWAIRARFTRRRSTLLPTTRVVQT